MARLRGVFLALQCALALLLSLPHGARAQTSTSAAAPAPAATQLALAATSGVFDAVVFTSARCTQLLSSLRIDPIPQAPPGAVLSSPAPAPADSFTLNVPTNKAPCARGQMAFYYPPLSVPANFTSVTVGSFGLFLQIIETLLPAVNFVIAAGEVADCPTSSSVSSPNALTLESVLLFTPAHDNVSIPSYELAATSSAAPKFSSRLLAPGVVYAAVQFNSSAFTPEQRASVSDAGATATLNDFFCFLANDTSKANAAAARTPTIAADDSPSGTTDPNAVPDFLADSQRGMSAGEIVGVASGLLISTVSIVVAVVVSRKQHHAQIRAKQQPLPLRAGL
jgi:hypothetical protein